MHPSAAELKRRAAAEHSMEIDAEVSVDSAAEAGLLSKRAEEMGFGCLWANETKHDPFPLLTLAAAATTRISVGTSIAVAFARSPTALAYTAWDLQNLSSGRFILGLGSQVKGHIERRFGMEWLPPVARMRDMVLAIRDVWACWQTGRPLNHQGRYYRLNLMTPFFSPGPLEKPEIPIFLAGVNEMMCALAGEVGDGIHAHPLHTVRYLREVVVPSVERGVTRGRRSRRDLSVAAPVFAAVGKDSAEIRKVREEYRGQVAFYASTRTYRRLMELHGWGDVCDRLHLLSVKGEWKKMPGEVPDDVLDQFVVDGHWEDIGQTLRSRYRGLVDRVRLYRPYDGSRGWRAVVAGFRA